MNISNAIESFVFHCNLERGLSKLTIAAYQIDLNQFKLTLPEDMHVANIDKTVVRKYLQRLDANYKPRSIKRKIATLKSFFCFLEQEEYIPVSPFRKLRLKLDRIKNLPRTLSLSSVTQLFNNIYHQKSNIVKTSREYLEISRDIAVLEVLFSTGIRVSEICKLLKRDVDLKNKQIIVMGKGKRERIIPLCDNPTLQALQNYQDLYEGFLSPESPFFLNRDKKPLSDQSVRKILKKHQINACIPEHFTPHMFRHTLATLLLENGVDIRNIQTLLGHSSLAVTEIYTHVSLAAQRTALEHRHPRTSIKLEEHIDN